MKTKSTTIHFEWLPAAAEWDFRSITERECRVASHWEYEREVSRSMPKFPGGEKYLPTNYRQAARELFPQAWTMLTAEERKRVLASFVASPAVQVRKLGDFLKRVTIQGGSGGIPQPYLERAYVLVPDFSGHGVEVVIKQLESWARKAAKDYPQARRAQAASLPFDTLKWLAALRVDEARRKAKVTISLARDTVSAFGKKYPRDHHGAVFPDYASDGAWSKARTDGLKCLAWMKSDPSVLLAELA